jgi:hypothetical protein
VRSLRNQPVWKWRTTCRNPVQVKSARPPYQNTRDKALRPMNPGYLAPEKRVSSYSFNKSRRGIRILNQNLKDKHDHDFKDYS